MLGRLRKWIDCGKDWIKIKILPYSRAEKIYDTNSRQIYISIRTRSNLMPMHDWQNPRNSFAFTDISSYKDFEIEYRNSEAIENDQKTVYSKTDTGIPGFVWWLI